MKYSGKKREITDCVTYLTGTFENKKKNPFGSLNVVFLCFYFAKLAKLCLCLTGPVFHYSLHFKACGVLVLKLKLLSNIFYVSECSYHINW